jgi:hypothetical protein
MIFVNNSSIDFDLKFIKKGRAGLTLPLLFGNSILFYCLLPILFTYGNKRLFVTEYCQLPLQDAFAIESGIWGKIGLRDSTR